MARTAARILAGAIGLLCLVGVFLCLERSVWIGAALATCVGMLATPGARRYLIPLVIAVSIGVGAALIFVPGLHQRVTARIDQKETLWDRRNLARAAINMVEARPLVGFGWARFQKDSADYFQQADDIPADRHDLRRPQHPTRLCRRPRPHRRHAVGAGTGVRRRLRAATRGPPDLLPWRIGLLTVAVATLVVISAVPPSAWPNRAIWLLAGVASSGRYRNA